MRSVYCCSLVCLVFVEGPSELVVPGFWEDLVAAVGRGEMDMHEAHKRHNLYNLARVAPCIQDAVKYIMDMDAAELPPVVFTTAAAYNLGMWQACRQAVESGQMGPFEAALVYYETMSNA